MKAPRPRKSNPRSGSRAAGPTGAGGGTGRIEDAKLNVILSGRGAQAPSSKFSDMVGYVQCLKQDPWLMVGMVRLIRMLRTGSFKLFDVSAGDDLRKPLPMRGPNLPPVVQLSRNPNRNQRWAEFLSQLMIHWAIKGTALVVDVATSASGAPLEIALLDPAQCVPKLRPDGTLESLRFGLTGSGRMEIPGEAVHVLRWNPDPEGGWFGMGLVAQNETHFNITTSMEEWVWSLFVNGQIPDGVLTVPGELDDMVRFRLYQQFEDRHRGAKRQHKPLVVEQGTTYTPGKGPQEMDFGEGRESRAEQTLAMVGVPPIRVGRTRDLNFASAYISDFAFIRDTYAPLCHELEEFLDLEVWERFGSYHGEFERPTAIADPQQAMSTAVAGVAGMIVTPNEARVLIGLKRVEDRPEMDEFYSGGLLTPARDLLEAPEAEPGSTPGAVPPTTIPNPFAETRPGAGATPPAPAGATPPAAGGKPPAPGTPPAAASPAAPATTIPNPFAGREADAIAKASPLQRRVLRHAIVARGKLARIMGLTAARYFRWLKPIVLERIQAAGKAYDPIVPPEADEAWKRVTRTFYVSALKRSYSGTLELFGGKPSGRFTEGGIRFEHAVNRLATKVTRVQEDTRTEIDRVIREGLEAGRPLGQIALGDPETGYAGVAGIFDAWVRTDRGQLASDARAMLIGRTETSAAYDQAAVEAYGELGVKVCDVIGCEDNHIMPGQKYGCNSQGIPIEEASAIEFHPNHKGVIAPRPPARAAWREALVLTRPDVSWHDWLKEAEADLVLTGVGGNA